MTANEVGRKTKKPNASLAGVARHAGVSLTTAERVLNERGSVSEKTRLKVLESAKALGVNRILPDRWHGIRHVEVILPANKTPLWRLLDASMKSLSSTLPRFISVHRTLVPEDDFAALEKAILRPKIRRSGLIIAADAAETIEPALREVMARGEHVITLVTDIPGLEGHHFAGIDNYTAGRTAAYLMKKSMRREGPVLVLPVHMRRQEHKDRLAGFEAVMSPARQVVVQMTYEIPGRTRAIVEDAIRTIDPAGIYATGHDSHEIAPVLAIHPDRPIWITHERTPLHMDYMRADLLDFVLDQGPDAQARWALYRMVEMCGLVGEGHLPAPTPPEMRLYCRENLM